MLQNFVSNRLFEIFTFFYSQQQSTWSVFSPLLFVLDEFDHIVYFLLEIKIRLKLKEFSPLNKKFPCCLQRCRSLEVLRQMSDIAQLPPVRSNPSPRKIHKHKSHQTFYTHGCHKNLNELFCLCRYNNFSFYLIEWWYPKL